VTNTKIPIKDSIGFNLIRGVFSIYIIIAIIVTLGHMVIEYFNVKQMIENDLALYQTTYEQQLSDALWDLEEDRIKTIVAGVIKLPSITAVQVLDAEHHLIVSQQKNTEITLSNNITNDQMIRHHFEIKYLRENEQSLVGFGVFYSNREVVLSKLSTGFTLIIINSIIKTLALWGIFLWLVKPMLVQPLEHLSKTVKELTVDDLSNFYMDIDSPKRNELKVLAESFNDMALRLHQSMQEINATSFALNHANNYLEQLLLSAQKMMQVDSKEQLLQQYVQYLYNGIETLQCNEVNFICLNRLTKNENKFISVDYKLKSQTKTKDLPIESIESIEFIEFMKLEERIVDQLPSEYQQITEYAYIEKEEVSSKLIIPFGTQDQTLGVITLSSLKEIILSPADASYLKTLTQLLTLIFNQLDNQQSLEQQVKIRTFELEESHHKIEQKAQELEKVSQYKTQFLANMSHEIRTPMNGIFGSLQILQHSVEDKESHELILTALTSCDSLLIILNDILDFSKIEVGKITLESNYFNIEQLLKIIANELQPTATEKSIELTLNFSQDYYKHWLGDPVRVKQILINIISNALKFTHEGSVNINVSGSQEILIEVVDTGIGMSVEALNSIFERFEQADKSTTREYGGTGLGVNIALSLAKLMRGSIKAQSKLDEGSRFVIQLPLERTIIPPMLKKESSRSLPELEHIDVLLAEDNAINRTIFNKLMTPTKANILMAKNGAECIELFNIHQPKVIFMDIQMPVMDGIEACKAIREKSNIPIIAVTANVMTEDVKCYKEVGFDCVLSKPIQLQGLYDACVKYIA